jgi:hypothetical protein
MLIQMLKKHYWLTQKGRKQYATLDTTLRSKFHLPFTLNLSQSSLPRFGISLHQQTTSNPFFYTDMSFFTKPPQNSYVSTQKKQKNYELNLQPLPKSNYQREFIFLGKNQSNPCRFG